MWLRSTVLSTVQSGLYSSLANWWLRSQNWNIFPLCTIWRYRMWYHSYRFDRLLLPTLSWSFPEAVYQNAPCLISYLRKCNNIRHRGYPHEVKEFSSTVHKKSFVVLTLYLHGCFYDILLILLELSSRVSIRCMQSAILFWQFCLSVRTLPVLCLNEWT